MMIPNENAYRKVKDSLSKDIWGYFHSVCERFWDKDFVVSGQNKFTFGELEKCSNQISTVLQKTNKKQVGVAIYAQDPRLVISAMVGAMKANDYFIFLDSTYPRAVLQETILHSDIEIILLDESLSSQFSLPIDGPQKIINIHLGLARDVNPTLPSVDPSPEDLVQLLFTSGSTGTPKGVMQTYRFFIQMLSDLALGDDSYVMMETANFNYSRTHSSVFGALVHGQTIVIQDVKTFGFDGFAETIRTWNVNVLKCLPTIFRNFVATLHEDDKFPNVQWVWLSGEKWLRQDLEKILIHFPSVEYARLSYGGSEFLTPTQTFLPIREVLLMDPPSSGMPLPHTRITLRNQNGEIVPAGEEGEVVVYGNYISPGYYNLPEQNRQKFSEDPANPGYRFYYTGDLAYFGTNGHLYITGRADHEVKIKGVRIQKDSLENHLLAYPGVSNVVCKVVSTPRGESKLAAYFSTEDGQYIPVSDLRRSLLEVFPVQQMPNFIIQVSEMPLTPTGKLNLNALPAPSFERPDLPNTYEPANTETEKAVLQIWEEMLGIQGIGVTDDLFEVGGDSLLAAMILMGMGAKFGKTLPVSILLIAPTVRALSALIDEKDTQKSLLPYIEFQEGGGGLPIFFIPGKGGYPIRIKHLGRSLDPSHPIYALQDSRPNRLTLDHNPIADSAKYLYQVIRDIVPTGPVMLIGESLGGKISYEIAQIMRANREPLPVLVLLDTYHNLPEGSSPLGRWDPKFLWDMAKKHTSILTKANGQGRREYLRHYAQLTISKMRKSFAADNAKVHRAPDPYEPFSILTGNNRELLEFSHKPYPGRVVLIKALREYTKLTPGNGWENVGIADLRIEPLDCYHGSILFEPAVTRLAEIVRKYI